jgi:hypothetical protein
VFVGTTGAVKAAALHFLTPCTPRHTIPINPTLDNPDAFPCARLAA